MGSPRRLDIEGLLERLGNYEITAILKFDHERRMDVIKPWTLVLSGPGVGGAYLIRIEGASLSECLEAGIERLKDSSGLTLFLDEFEI